MPIRRTFRVAVVTLALGGALAPMFSTSHAQNVPPGATDRAPATTADDRGSRGPDFGWLGILGLAGLAGLMGNRREHQSSTRNPSTTPAR